MLRLRASPQRVGSGRAPTSMRAGGSTVGHGKPMKRRAFTAGLLAAWLPSAGRAQERPRIGILHSGFPRRTPIHLLFEALAQLGYEHGRTATIELHGGEGNPDRLNAVVAELATQRPHVIV